MKQPTPDRATRLPLGHHIDSKRSDVPASDLDDEAPTSYVPALRWHALTPAYDLVVRVSSDERRVKQALLDHAGLQGGERVLDVGCGTGTLLSSARERAPELDLHRVDRDPAVLRRATTRVGPAALFLSDARRMPIGGATIDVALSSLFFHHLHDDAKSAVFAEIARVLTSAGRLIVADWGAPRSMWSRLAAATVCAFDGADPTRTNFAGGLAGVMAANGFADVDVVERIGVPLGVIDIITATADPARVAR